MGQITEVAYALRRVSFDNSTTSAPIDLRGFKEFYLHINAGLQGQTINIDAQVASGVWTRVLDAAGAAVVVPATTEGLVLIDKLPTWYPIRFTVAGAITTSASLDCKA